MKLNLTGLFTEPSGYGKMAREYAIALYLKGVDVAAIPLTESKLKKLSLSSRDFFIMSELLTFNPFGDAIALQFYVPDFYHPSLSSVRNIGYCELETDRLPKWWVNHCNQMQEIWVPTRFFKEVAKESGVKTEIRVIPQGIDTDVFRPDVKPLPLAIDQKFKFFMNGEFIERKNFRMALEAYWDTFRQRDDVCMVIKTYDLSDPNFARNIPRKIAEWKGDRRKAAPIYLLNDFIRDRDLPRLYNAVDCLVHPAAGEGWGFPPLEALACEKPVIYTGWGGLDEILPREAGYRLNYKLVEIPKFGIPNDKVFAGARWAEPNKEELRSYMRRVVNDYGAAVKKAKDARFFLRQNLSWNKAADNILARVKEINSKRKNPPGGSFVQMQWTTEKVGMICPSWGKKCGIATYTEGLMSGFSALGKEGAKVVVNGDSQDIDIYHFQFQYGLYTNLTLEETFDRIARSGRTIIVTMHDFGPAGYEHNRLIWRYASRIIVHSDRMRNVLVENGFLGNHISVVPHGFNADVYLSNKAKKIIADKNLIGYFGFAYDHKGLIELGQAAEILSQKGIRLKVFCSIGVNSRASQQYWERVRKFFNRRNLWQYIDLRSRFMERERLVEELAGCAAIVLPYEDYGQEGSSGAVREAMLAGRPVIVTDTPFFRDLWPEDHVYKMPDNDPETIAARVFELREAGVPPKMEAKIRGDSWRNIADEHLRIYRKELASIPEQ